VIALEKALKAVPAHMPPDCVLDDSILDLDLKAGADFFLAHDAEGIEILQAPCAGLIRILLNHPPKTRHCTTSYDSAKSQDILAFPVFKHSLF
jgi:hypothetical protein